MDLSYSLDSTDLFSTNVFRTALYKSLRIIPGNVSVSGIYRLFNNKEMPPPEVSMVRDASFRPLLISWNQKTELGTLTRVKEQGERADLLLHPPVRKFGMTEVKSFDQMVETSYRYALEELAKWVNPQ